MTRRLTPEEKARNAYRRKLAKMTPKERAHLGLHHRTPKETAEYLAFIKAQGEATIERGQRIAAAYAADEVRVGEELSHGHRMRRAGGHAGRVVAGDFAPPFMFPGATLAEKIGAKTRMFHGPRMDFNARRRRVAVRKPWWRFW